MPKHLLQLVIMGAILTTSCASIDQPHENLSAYLQDFNPAVALPITHSANWWQTYQDPQLNKLVDLALANNIDLAKAAINVNKALYQAKLVTADLVPQFSLDGATKITKDLKNTSSASEKSSSANAAISYELDLWHKLANSASAAKWSYLATEADKQAAQHSLINSVVDAYYKLAFLTQALELNQQNLTRLTEIARIVKAQYQVGKVSSQNNTQIQQSLINQQNTLTDLHSQLAVAKQSMRNLLNLKPNQDLDSPKVDLINLVLPKIDSNLPLSVLENRPDLQASLYRLKSSFKDLKAMQTSWLPTISLAAAVNSSADHLKESFNFPIGVAGLTLKLPFLQWNSVKWNIKTSRANYEAAKLDLEQQLTTALNEVYAYYIQYQNLISLQPAWQQQYQLAQKSTNYYKTRYTSGAEELKSWLEAINNESTSQQTLVQQRYQLIRQINQLYKAMAGSYTLQ